MAAFFLGRQRPAQAGRAVDFMVNITSSAANHSSWLHDFLTNWPAPPLGAWHEMHGDDRCHFSDVPAGAGGTSSANRGRRCRALRRLPNFRRFPASYCGGRRPTSSWRRSLDCYRMIIENYRSFRGARVEQRATATVARSKRAAMKFHAHGRFYLGEAAHPVGRPTISPPPPVLPSSRRGVKCDRWGRGAAGIAAGRPATPMRVKVRGSVRES